MAGTPIDFIRYNADAALSVPDQINMRPYTMIITTTTWSGDINGRVAPGVGTPVKSSLQLFNFGTVNPRYREVSVQEIALSNGQLRDLDIKIGPFVFPYDTAFATGGIDPKVFDQSVNSTTFQLNIIGPNYPAPLGANFKKIYHTTQHLVMYYVFLRNMATI